jgi:hypothetical protein
MSDRSRNLLARDEDPPSRWKLERPGASDFRDGDRPANALAPLLHYVPVHALAMCATRSSMMPNAARVGGTTIEGITRCLILALAISMIGCRTASPRRSEDEGPVRTTIDVQNQGFSDMTVYVLVNGARTRLGLAPGNKTTVLTIPPYLLNGTTFLRFVADPIGGNRTPVTEEVDVSPGDQLVMLISPGS